MSAIKLTNRHGRGPKMGSIHWPNPNPTSPKWADPQLPCVDRGKLSLVMSRDGYFAIAWRGQIPETVIAVYIGAKPEELVQGFSEMKKPIGCEWMSRSRIKSIVNHMDSVLVELETAS